MSTYRESFNLFVYPVDIDEYNWAKNNLDKTPQDYIEQRNTEDSHNLLGGVVVFGILFFVAITAFICAI